MKTKKNRSKQNGHVSAHALVAKAATAKRLAKAARQHLKAVKFELKQSRKAFKQAKKAAKIARREAKQALKASSFKKPARTAKTHPKSALATRPTRAANGSGGTHAKHPPTLPVSVTPLPTQTISRPHLGTAG